MSNDPNDCSGCLHGTLCSGGQCPLARPLVDQLYPLVWPLGGCHAPVTEQQQQKVSMEGMDESQATVMLDTLYTSPL